ncbi:MAG: YdcF family protein [Anaerolineae bacterium]
MTKRAWLRRFIFITLIAAVIGLAAMVAAIDAYGLVDRAQPADVIVVLGSQVFPGGRAGPSLARRADHAAALYHQGYAAHVICTGGFAEPEPKSEAQVACERIVAAGVPREAVTLEERATGTEENAAFTAAIMRERGWLSAIIASDGYHLLRATLMFQRAGVEAYPSPAQVTAGPMHAVERIVREVREAGGIIWFGVRVLLRIDLTA